MVRYLTTNGEGRGWSARPSRASGRAGRSTSHLVQGTALVGYGDAVLAGDFVRARVWHRKTCMLADEIGRFGPNPLPIKTALAMTGRIAEEVRLPLCPMDEEPRTRLQVLLGEAGLLTSQRG